MPTKSQTTVFVKAICGFIFLVLSIANAAAASPANGIFEWQGRFNADSPAGRPGGTIDNWIEGGWDIKIEAKLECESPSIPGYQIPLIRYYSIKSVSFKIPFQYLAFLDPDYRTGPPIIEDYLIVLGPSDFDLTYPPNLDGVPEIDTIYNGSWVGEYHDMPTAGAYRYQIFLKHDAQQIFITPKRATFTVGGGSVGIRGGFCISHQSDDPPELCYGLGPDGTDFFPPPAYQYPYDLPYWYDTKETEALYKTIRFLDEEDESRLVVGAVADGRSRVIVELDGVQSSANVTIPDGDGTWVTGPTLQNGVWRRTWQAPESYGGSENDNTQGKIPIGFAIVIDGQSIAPSPFNLYKAPVVMLHGIWSNASIWSPLQNALRQDGFLFTHAESYPNQASFSDNSIVTSNHVEHALAQVRDLGLVAKKADIVAHSMGGCLAKMEVSNKEYIRRIVTVGTPHYGSPVANRLLERPWIEPILNGLRPPRSMNAGAVEDLRAGFHTIPGDSLQVPVLAINGIVAPNDELPLDASVYIVILKILLFDLRTSSLHYDLFGLDTSDWVVSDTSQKGGLTGQNTQDVIGVWHCRETENAEFIEKTIAFLNAPSDSVSAMIAQQTVPLEDSQAATLEESQFLIDQPVVQQVSSSALASNGITITTPAAGTVFSPGDTVHVAVSTPPTATQVLVVLSDGSVVVDNTTPFEIDIPIPQQSLGEMTIGALAWDTNGIIGTASTTVTVTTTATVTSLKVWPDSVLYLNAGETVPFVVHGIFSDGIERDITTSQCGTAYNTTDSSVANIDTAGVLTAKAPGYCSVVVSNGDSMQIPVLVQGPLPSTTGKFGSFDDQKNLRLTLKDCNNNDVMFMLAGAGYGEIDCCDCTFSSITLYDTTEKSVLTIKTKGKTETSIGDIIINGSLKGITAKNVNLRGDITVTGSLGTLTLNDVADDHTITIGSPTVANPKAAVTIAFDQVSDLTINSEMPIKMLTATEWLGGSLNAPSVGSITTKGDKKRGISGDLFEVDLNLSQKPDAKILALGKLTVKGWIDSSRILSAGNIGSISAGVITNSSCFAGVTDTNDLNADGVLDLPDPVVDVNYVEPATIKSITVKGIKGEPYCVINSNIAAAQILSASLAYPENENGGIPFGLSAGFIKALKIKGAEGTESWKNLDKPSDSKEFGDAKVLLY